jgi:hypothetical protein
MSHKVLSGIVWTLTVAIVVLGAYFVYTKLIVNADANSVSADLNNDGTVNALDLNSLIKAVDDKSENPKFDLNNDGKVDSSDIDVLIKSWPKPSVTATE